MRALATMVFVGVQPTLIQVPPTCSRSMMAVLRPASAKSRASGFPAWPDADYDRIKVLHSRSSVSSGICLILDAGERNGIPSALVRPRLLDLKARVTEKNADGLVCELVAVLGMNASPFAK